MNHGRSAYSYHRCRCDICKTANREYMRQNRKSVVTASVPVPPGARLRAAEELIRRHPNEFQALLKAQIAPEDAEAALAADWSCESDCCATGDAS